MQMRPLSCRANGLPLLAVIVLLSSSHVFAIDLLVYNNNDNGAGSLRQAVNDNNATAGGNTIILSNVVTGTITLTGGELLINKNLTILGPGTSVLAVNGNAASRVFHVSAGTVSISGLTISNGRTNGNGGGIWNTSVLALSHCSVSQNRTAASGGGIFNDTTASLTLSNCLVSDNTAYISGGGIYSYNATLTIVNSTIAANIADTGSGGGIRMQGGTNDTRSSTLAINSTTVGGGIASTDNAKLTLRNSLIARNTADTSPDLLGAFTSAGYNLIGKSDTSSGFTNAVSHDQVGTAATPLEPLLGPLTDNGGPTKTMALALRVGSPAIDKGNRFGLATDQRGQPRYDNPDVANASGGDGADIGAYEASELRIVNAQKTGNHLRLDFLSWLGTKCEVQSRSDLASGTYTSLPGSTPGNGGIVSVTVSNAFGVPQQFYRIHPVPCPPGTPGCPWQTGDASTRTQIAWDTTTSWFAAYDSIYAPSVGRVEVGIPGPSGFSLIFTGPDRVTDFLVQTGPAAALNVDLMDTTSSSANQFGGEMIVLRLNVDFSAAGQLGSLALGSLHLCNMTDPSLNGITVNDLLAIANTLLGGGSNGYSIGAIDVIVAELNGAFFDGFPSAFAVAHLVNGPCP